MTAFETIENKIEELLNKMTLEEKVSLCHANSKFYAGGIERLGIEELSMIDGPHGVRSEVKRDEWTCLNREEDKCTCLPAETALAATWNPKLARRFGETLGSEARFRGKDIILGPGVNIIRSPLCGRNFEYMSEDPCLIEKISPELVKGIQSQDTAACVKHFALNNQETDRGHVNVEVSKRALHEIYLRGFRAAIIDGGAYSVMGAYNQYKNQHCCHNDILVNQILKGSWGFDGVYLTDWAGCHDTEEAIFNGLDLEMGTNKPYNEYYLADAFLERAKESEEVRVQLDEKVRRLLRLMFRVNKFDSKRKAGEFNTREHQQATYDIAAEAMVLLKNEENILPINKDKVKKILVVGPNAKKLFAAGGGSCGVRTPYEITQLEGIKSAFPDCEIEYENVNFGDPYQDIPVQQMDIIEMKAGVRAFKTVKHITDENGLQTETTEYTQNAAIDHIIADSFDLECRVCIPETGEYGFRISTSLGYSFKIDDKPCLSRPYFKNDANGRYARFDEYTASFKEGEHICLKIHIDSRNADPVFKFGWMTPSDFQSVGNEEHIWKKAKESDYVLYSGGLDHSFDTEGMDRVSMKLPWGQDTVISKLAELNPNTVVLITAGSQVEMPWIDKVKAVLWCWYAGMEAGNVLGDILTGKICPSGKMPFTLPYKYEDMPVARYGEFKPINCKYNEDIFVGYRGFEHDNVKPMFAFGHGLSYSNFTYSDLEITATDKEAKVSFKVKNTGDVKAMETAQLYIGDPICSVERPIKELRNFQKVELMPQEEVTVGFTVTATDLSFYDENTEEWKLESGEFTAFVGSSSEDIRLQGSFCVDNHIV